VPSRSRSVILSIASVVGAMRASLPGVLIRISVNPCDKRV
jgi:hypothetical protein